MTDIHQLVKDCLKNKPSAQKALYDKYAPEMLGVCYRYTKSIADAEDVLQNGFVRVYSFLHQYRFEGDLGAWIRRIMVNAALTYLKKKQQYREDFFFTDSTELVVVSPISAEINITTKELAQLIRQLPTGYQTIFNLYAVEGYSHVEIGKMLGISDITSRTQYARARKVLAEWIKNYSEPQKQVYGKK